MAGAPAVSPIPNGPVYAQEATLANNAYNNALAQINQSRLNTLTQFGYTGTVDPVTGVVSGIGVDPHSMYGSLQQMLHGHALEDQSADTAAQDRGLVGGLAHQGHSLAHYAHGADLTGLGQALTGQLSDLQGKQQAAGETLNDALWQAEMDQLNSTLSSQAGDTLDQLLNPGGDSSGGGGDSGGSSGSGSGAGATTASGGSLPTYRGKRDFVSSTKARAQKKIISRARPKGDK